MRFDSSIFHLKKKDDFALLKKEGKRLNFYPLILIYRSNGLGHLRTALSISRKLGKAIHRNRWRRMIREYLRKESYNLSFDLMIIVKSDSLKKEDNLKRVLPVVRAKLAKC